MGDQPQKICAICGEDCAGQPRTRDPRGRYAHEAYIAKIRAQRAAAEAAKGRFQRGVAIVVL